jgi:hypothetical protein
MRQQKSFVLERRMTLGAELRGPYQRGKRRADGPIARLRPTQ